MLPYTYKWYMLLLNICDSKTNMERRVMITFYSQLYSYKICE